VSDLEVPAPPTPAGGEASEGDSGWRKYLTDYNEGLGVVYERLMLNDYFASVVTRFRPENVLEAPLYGMAGVSGINSVAYAQAGLPVTIVDDSAERLAGVTRIWGELGLPVTAVQATDFAALPFADGSFDLAWNHAALWYLPDAAGLLAELARVSRRLILIAMPNRLQVGYFLRKYWLEREFFDTIDERWVDLGRARRFLERRGFQLVEQGVLDVPPWPDTCMPASELLRRVGIRSRRLERRFASNNAWQWSTIDYYSGRRPELRAQIDRMSLFDRLPLPWQLKTVWAHHRYILMVRA
jgi:SAM-dependent methyltransferase